MAGAFDHHLHAIFPSELCQFAERLQFGELRAVIGIGDGARTQPVAERIRHVIGAHDLVDLADMRVEEILPVMRQTPFRQDRAAARYDAGHP